MAATAPPDSPDDAASNNKQKEYCTNAIGSGWEKTQNMPLTTVNNRRVRVCAKKPPTSALHRSSPVLLTMSHTS